MKNSLHTLKEAMKYLGVSRTTLYHLIRSGELPVVELRGCKRIAPEDLTELISRQRT
jgi:excisionase family DNA binding protein